MVAIELVTPEKQCITAPSSHDVLNALARIHQSDPGQPLVIIASRDDDKGPVDKLELARLNNCESGVPDGWLLRHVRSNEKHSHVLAASNSGNDAFERRELFGAFEDIRAVCILSDELVKERVLSFVATGACDHNWIWLDFRDSVRSA